MALHLNGTTGNIQHGRVQDTEGIAALTAMLWFNPDVVNTSPNVQSLVGKGDPFGAYNFLIETRNADLSLNNPLDAVIAFIYDGAAGPSGRTGAVLTPGTWTHIAVVFNGAGATNPDRLKIYINGVNQALAFGSNIPAALQSNTQNLHVGMRFGGSGYVDGLVAQLRIWLAALSAGEVAAEYIRSFPMRWANLELYSRYDDGTTAADFSGQGNNGTVVGAAQEAGPPGLSSGSAGILTATL